MGVYIGCTCGKVGAVIAVMLGIVSVAGLLTYGVLTYDGDVKTPANATAAVILGGNHELL